MKKLEDMVYWYLRSVPCLTGHFKLGSNWMYASQRRIFAVSLMKENFCCLEILKFNILVGWQSANIVRKERWRKKRQWNILTYIWNMRVTCTVLTYEKCKKPTFHECLNFYQSSYILLCLNCWITEPLLYDGPLVTSFKPIWALKVLLIIFSCTSLSTFALIEMLP